MLKEVVCLLKKLDLEFALFSSLSIEDIESKSLELLRTSDLDSMIFVCGPIVVDWQPFQDLVGVMERNEIPFIGINVLILSPQTNPFAETIARVGLSKSFFDLSPLQTADGNLLAHFKRKLQFKKSIKVGVVLRGHQIEYGEDRCNCEVVKQLIYQALEELESDAIELCYIDHKLKRNALSVSEYDQIYQSLDFVLTTRFHSAIMAIRNLIPFTAIDQIECGAKVTSLLCALCPDKVIDAHCLPNDLTREIESELSSSLRLKLLLLLKARKFAKSTRAEVSNLLLNLSKST